MSPPEYPKWRMSLKGILVATLGIGGGMALIRAAITTADSTLRLVCVVCGGSILASTLAAAAAIGWAVRPAEAIAWAILCITFVVIAINVLL